MKKIDMSKFAFMLVEQMKKIAMFTFVFMLFINMADALDCSHDNESYYTEFNKIDMVCQSKMRDYSCLSFVRNMSGQLLSVNPVDTNIQQIGRIEHFESNGQIVRIEFRPMPNIIRPLINYTYGVICSNGSGSNMSGVEQFNITMMPRYKELDIVAEKTIYLKDYTGYILITVIVLLFGVAILLWIIKKARGG